MTASRPRIRPSDEEYERRLEVKRIGAPEKTEENSKTKSGGISITLFQGFAACLPVEGAELRLCRPRTGGNDGRNAKVLGS